MKTDMENQELNTNLCFRDILRENTENYIGEHKEYIQNAYPVYMLCCHLLNDNNIRQPDRIKLFAAIGYFVIPHDVYPEDELGPIGYIEDILLCIYIIRGIEKIYGFEILQEYWEKEIEVLQELLYGGFESMVKRYEVIFQKVLRYTGI